MKTKKTAGSIARNILSIFLYNGKITTVMIAPFNILNGITNQIIKVNKSVTLWFNTVPMLIITSIGITNPYNGNTM